MKGTVMTARTEAIQQIAQSHCPHLSLTSEIDSIYGCDVFSLEVLQKRLPKPVFKALKATINKGELLDSSIADTVACVMKDWAIAKGATHYTHWFQPMTGLTAEKHDAFLSTTGEGRMINEFSGKMLICGEPDASSFPSGGIRSTFEARGYTAWDPTVPAFVIGTTLHIPTLFYSYSGEALDRKIPLLRSISALSRQALRILRLFGNEKATFVKPNVGPEQEYFLVDRRLAVLRPDIMLAGRTLTGTPPAKGQEMEDHYFGSIPERVLAFMQDVEHALFRLGIPAKTRHNEVAPGQFELAPIYEDANAAVDHNMIMMNLLHQIAPKHDFVCLLHEKPFAGVNGSGKHNNWSISDSEGNNLLDPGSTPLDNAQFLVFLAAVLRAVHKHSAVLRLGTVGAGNDHRLGANEAPPAIISVYLGDMLTDVLDTIMNGVKHAPGRTSMEIGVSLLPPLPVDLSDRNRTSPFAFTGNKFEFRAVGSSQSISPVNIALNTAMACALDDIATELETAVAGGVALNTALQELLPRLFREHQAVVFNGNGYSSDWPEEAARRGLPNLSTTVEALEHYSSPEVMEVFLRQNVLTEREMLARQEILLDSYAKSVSIEGALLLDMVRTRILPAALGEQTRLADTVLKTRSALGEAEAEEAHLAQLREHTSALFVTQKSLEKALDSQRVEKDVHNMAHIARDMVLPAMTACREHCDALERMVSAAAWPLPSYAELLWLH